MRRLVLFGVLLAACSSETEVMLVVKAARSLPYGQGAAIDALQIQTEVASDPAHLTANKTVDLCAPESTGSPTCRPQQYVDESYDGELTLPIHILMRPGSAEPTADVDVFVLAQRTLPQGTNSSTTQVRLRTHLQFTFSPGHRLWLDVPLYGECLDAFSCQDVNQICKSDCLPDADGTVPATCCASVATDPDEPSEDLSPGSSRDLSYVDLPPPDLAPPPMMCGKIAGDPCCPGSTCNGPLNCDANGICQSGSTGGVGQPCNGDSSCNTTDLRCQSNLCVLICGQPGQPCCTQASNVCSVVGEHCYKPDGTETFDPANASDGICNNCGNVGDWCCPRTQAMGPGYCNPSANAECDNASGTSFRCQACGMIGKQCCGTTCSDPNSYCAAGTCAACGVKDKFCCPPASTCGMWLYCDSTQTCEDCGDTGQICCLGNSCRNGPPMFMSLWRTLGLPNPDPDGGSFLPPDMTLPPPFDGGTSSCTCP